MKYNKPGTLYIFFISATILIALLGYSVNPWEPKIEIVIVSPKSDIPEKITAKEIQQTINIHDQINDQFSANAFSPVIEWTD